MSYIRQKRIGNNSYAYEQESYRDDSGQVHTRHIRYVGKSSGLGTTNDSDRRIDETPKIVAIEKEMQGKSKLGTTKSKHIEVYMGDKPPYHPVNITEKQVFKKYEVSSFHPTAYDKGVYSVSLHRKGEKNLDRYGTTIFITASSKKAAVNKAIRSREAKILYSQTWEHKD